MDQMTPADIIREARNKLFELGWTKHCLQDDETKEVCAIGALYAAICGVEENGEIRWEVLQDNGTIRKLLVKLESFLKDAVPDSPRLVAYYNDAAGRTFDQIIELFDKAEKYAEAHYGE